MSLIFASEEWSKIKNVREYIDEPEPTKTSFASVIWSLIITLFLARMVNRRIKKKKNLW